MITIHKENNNGKITEEEYHKDGKWYNKNSEVIVMNKSKERALEIINIFVNKCRNINYIKSIFLVGSLSDNTYTGNSGSDIDLIIIINDDCDYFIKKKELITLINKVEDMTNNDIPIAKVIYQYKMLIHPYKYDFEIIKENNDLINLPIEVLRIKNTGKCIYGDNFISLIEYPLRDDIIKHHQLSNQLFEKNKLYDKQWYDNYLKKLDNPTPRLITQIVLTNAMSDYYFYTNNNCSSKYKILEVIQKELPNFEYLELIKICHKYRFNLEQFDERDLELMMFLYKNKYQKRSKTW